VGGTISELNGPLKRKIEVIKELRMAYYRRALTFIIIVAWL